MTSGVASCDEVYQPLQEGNAVVQRPHLIHNLLDSPQQRYVPAIVMFRHPYLPTQRATTGTHAKTEGCDLQLLRSAHADLGSQLSH